MSKEIKDLREAAITNGAAWMALAELLIRKGVITLDEFDRLKEQKSNEMLKEI